MVAKFGDPNPLSPHTYVCQIESDGQTIREQQAASGCFGGDMDSLRRVLRGIFKRGKKRKQVEERSPKPPQPPAVPPKDSQPTPAPRPPSQDCNSVKSASPNAAATAPEVANGPPGFEERNHEQTAHVADDQDQSTAQPNDDGVAEAVVAAPPEAAVAAPAVTDSKPAHITSTGESDTPPIAEATKENTHPSGVTPEASPANNEAKSHPVVSRGSSEDKIPVNVHEEPPPIRRVQAVPGMSATSGPLEDYPEGGDFS